MIIINDPHTLVWMYFSEILRCLYFTRVFSFYATGYLLYIYYYYIPQCFRGKYYAFYSTTSEWESALLADLMYALYAALFYVYILYVYICEESVYLHIDIQLGARTTEQIC